MLFLYFYKKLYNTTHIFWKGEIMEEVDFDTIKEEWNEYKLKDGTSMKIKIVLVKVVRGDNYDQFGDPVYMVNTQNIVKVSNVPKELKRGSESSMVR